MNGQSKMVRYLIKISNYEQYKCKCSANKYYSSSLVLIGIWEGHSGLKSEKKCNLKMLRLKSMLNLAF